MTAPEPVEPVVCLGCGQPPVIGGSWDYEVSCPRCADEDYPTGRGNRLEDAIEDWNVGQELHWDGRSPEEER